MANNKIAGLPDIGDSAFLFLHGDRGKFMKKLAVAVFTFLVAICLNGYAQADLSDGLQIHYSFDGDTNDLSTNANHGISNVNFAPGIVGQAAEFNGIDSFVMSMNNIQIDTTAPKTVCAWVKNQDSAHAAGIVGLTAEYYPGTGFQHQSESAGQLTLIGAQASQSNTTEIAFFSGTKPSNVVTTLPNAFQHNTWYFLVGVAYGSQTGNELKIYVNGEPAYVVQTGSNNFSSVADDPFRVGHREYDDELSHFFDGLIDEVRYYDRALSNDEIKELYVTGALNASLLNLIDRVIAVNDQYNDVLRNQDRKLNRALIILNDQKYKNDTAALGIFNSFLNVVEDKKNNGYLPIDYADQLTNRINEIVNITNGLNYTLIMENFEDNLLDFEWSSGGDYIIQDGILNMYEGYPLPPNNMNSYVGIKDSEGFIYKIEADINVSPSNHQQVGLELDWMDEFGEGRAVSLFFHTETSEFVAYLENWPPMGWYTHRLESGQTNQWYRLGITLHENYVAINIDGRETILWQDTFQKPQNFSNNNGYVHGGSLDTEALGYFADNIKVYTSP